MFAEFSADHLREAAMPLLFGPVRFQYLDDHRSTWLQIFLNSSALATTHQELSGFPCAPQLWENNVAARSIVGGEHFRKLRREG
jgi:hypothetical protein